MKHANALINKVRSGGGPCVVYSVHGAMVAVFICGASAGLSAPTAQGFAWLGGQGLGRGKGQGERVVERGGGSQRHTQKARILNTRPN